ncbi:hypothetical protein ACTHGU_18990 [Chitinophagaceae bacterium MMS25-I14]
MKKILLGATALSFLFATSCKKKDDGGSSNSWTLNGASYSVLTATAGGNTLTAANGNASNANGVYFNFTTYPTANGTYKVVENATNANEVDITTLTYSGATFSTYGSTGNDNINATVTVNNGKVSINVPSVWMKNSTTGTDSVKLTANVTQTQ